MIGFRERKVCSKQPFEGAVFDGQRFITPKKISRNAISQIGNETTFDGNKTSENMPRPAKQNQYSQIGQNIKLVREWKRMSPKVFADEMDVTVHTVHDWENGKTDLPHYRVANAAKVFNMSLPKLETAHEWLPVTINTPHDNHVVFNAGTINSEGAALNDCVQELRNQLAQKDGQITKKDEQLAQKDERIALLEKRIDDLLEKLSSRV